MKDIDMRNKIESMSKQLSHVANSPWTDLGMVLMAVLWIILIVSLGELWHYWGDILIAIASLLMFFVLQTTQSLDHKSTQAKLDEILILLNPKDSLIGADEDNDLDTIEHVRKEQKLRKHNE